MVWDSKLETGVTLIDEQHKELFRRVDALMAAGRQRRGADEMAKTIAFLEEYIVKHFRDEEALQAKSNYPKALTHKIQHDTYVREFQQLKQQYQQNGASLNVILSVNKSIVNWLTQHINTHDKEFTLYYRNLNAK